MLINEKGLVLAIKRAYKGGGYVVVNDENSVSIYTENWYIRADRDLLPRKVLATIVEHMGMIPEINVPTSVVKDEDPQLVMDEVATDDIVRWRTGQHGEEVTMVPVIMQGYQISSRLAAAPAGAYLCTCWT